MRKSTKRIAIAVGAAAMCMAAVIALYPRQTDTVKPQQAEEQTEPSDVTVSINREQETIPVYEEITDDETGELVTAEVQENEPIEQKPTTPPEKPKAEGSYTNPDAPPVYKEEQTKSEPQKKSVPQSSANTSGKVYVEGFGYVEKAGETKTQTGVSDGDINKMVGSMD
ncbi:MAG: hypothetical protein Q4C12_07645 [Clostridia bacterium]|nr:hypothetical protein [Clostridia bacterium]